jgi:F-type H+-transporting ATPase subunit gamma
VKRPQTLQRQLASLAMLGAAVNAMKSLSAHHLRASRKALADARRYRDGIDRLIAAAGIVQLPPAVEEPGLLLIAADLGLCGGYNARLAEAALAEGQRLGPRALYAVGRRPLAALRRAGVTMTRTYPAVTSVNGLTGLLLTLADDVLGDYLRGAFNTLTVVSARFEGVGVFRSAATRVLPIVSHEATARAAAAPYVSTLHLTRIAVREYLYSTLYEILLDALASEHGARLVATQSAGQWLDDRVAALQRQLSAVRRESSTQEVLEVAAGARRRPAAETNVTGRRTASRSVSRRALQCQAGEWNQAARCEGRGARDGADVDDRNAGGRGCGRFGWFGAAGAARARRPQREGAHG